ncbi:CPBP family intramembrane metalloprotease [Lentilactobacillus hilgardii]|nr:type II CAAX endopeptidase family protein [Lentilactobacillus hilgardii]MCV3742737.1 CPBP family intramembrane metalloprotease [Lentilactobacillus hilgardii]
MQKERKTMNSADKKGLLNAKTNHQKERHYFKSTSIYHTLFYLIVSFLLYQIVSIPLPFGQAIHGRSWAFMIFFILFIAITATVAIRFAFKSYQEVMTSSVRIAGRDVDFKQVFKVFAVSLIGIVLFSALSDLVVPTTENQTMLEQSINANTAVGFVLMVVIVSPILEELIFRGLFINLIFKDNLFWLPIIASAAVFALFHETANIPQYLIYFVMGMILGFAYMKTGRLLTSILLHMANNVYVTFGFFFSSSFIAIGIVVVLEIAVVGVVLWFAKIASQNGWFHFKRVSEKSNQLN